jgi:(hydroxyamino)benzene mutase
MSSQTSLAVILIRSGALQLTTAFVWGTIIAHVPYPRIALSTHMNLIHEGFLAIAAGLLTRDPALVKLQGWQMNIVTGAHLGVWVFDLISMCNSWWGTKRTMKMVSAFFDS